ncbi:MAG: hypothetical protein HYU97_04885 [Deltaproteobacteria bacterium]|nr:hypothetical protein [Deltaproteobacteria bacterium]
MVEKKQPVLHIFAKVGLNQNLIQLALGKLGATFIFYPEFTESLSKKAGSSDVIILDDSIPKFPTALLKSQVCIFLLSQSSNSPALAGNQQNIILHKPFSPGELRGVLQKLGVSFHVC